MGVQFRPPRKATYVGAVAKASIPAGAKCRATAAMSSRLPSMKASAPSLPLEYAAPQPWELDRQRPYAPGSATNIQFRMATGGAGRSQRGCFQI
jgi:hypothetical protein